MLVEEEEGEGEGKVEKGRFPRPRGPLTLIVK